MNKSLSIINLFDSNKIDVQGLEDMSSILYEYALDGILSNRVNTLEETFQVIQQNFEKISNYLDLKKEKNSACFNFGRIVSITNLILEISKNQNSLNSLDNISKSYPLLLPALKIIKSHNTISGVDLQKEMNFKSSSSLSNFLHRIKPFNLVVIRKIGTRNYISLTSKGKTLLRETEKQSSCLKENLITLTELFSLLDYISKELIKNEPNSTKIIHKCLSIKISVEERKILKYKIDQIFCSRDSFFHNMFKNISCNQELEKDNNYSFDDYQYDNLLSLENLHY